MQKLLDLSTDTTSFPHEKLTTSVGLESTIAVALALTLGQLTGHTSAGAIAAGSAFTIGFAVFHEALDSALISMALVTLGIGSATLAGSLTAEWTPLVLVLVLIAAVNYGLLSCLGPTAAWIGQQSGVFVIVASYFPRGAHYALGRTAMVLAGGALQMLVFTVLHTVRRHTPPSPHKLTHLPSKIGYLWSTLRFKLKLRGSTGAYIARLSMTLLLCTAIYRYFHVRNGYWAPMTALLVLKPQFSGTLSRGIARMLGTVGGAALALLLARFLPLHPAIIFALVLVAAWACYALQAVNYALFSFFVTLYIVFLFRFGGFSQTSAAHIRLFNTLLGGFSALVIDALWQAFAARTQRPAAA